MQIDPTLPRGDRDIVITALLCVFLGVFGAHRLYLRRYKTALLMLLTGGALGMWVIVDFILILTHRIRDGDGKALKL